MEKDLSKNGDSYHTLAGKDPNLLNYEFIEPFARAYVDKTPLNDHRVSPIYSEYPKGFPATLIQSGTRDLFLSNCCRLHHKLRKQGISSVLSVHEGMWHGFYVDPDTPEREQAQKEVANFIRSRLGVK